MSSVSGATWWQKGVIYQIYPRSFQDSGGDGVGDLPGILRRLDYLQWLGVDILWICPFYPSPMADFGYDVADYTAVDPLFGTMADFDRLLAEAHRRGLRVVLDFVPNHTSELHPWFLASRSSRSDPRRPWYLWHDPAPGGGPPNNWRSRFGGSGWELDATTGQYYYHTFLREQPDLNWRHPGVQEAILAALRFWLEKGVDGFRLDAVWNLIKDERLRDDPPKVDIRPEDSAGDPLCHRHSADRPEIHPVLAAMRREVDAFADRLLIGEIYLPPERLIPYYGTAGRPELHLPTNFQLTLRPWRAAEIAGTIGGYEALLPAGTWPHWAVGNHDSQRVASRIGAAQARVAAMLLLTLRGTPVIYNGDELGLPDGPPAARGSLDPLERNLPGLGRDRFRTPIPWDASAGAGFTTGRPWLPLHPDWRRRCVAAQREDAGSILHLHRRLLSLRRAEPTLAAGPWGAVPAAGDLVAWLRPAASGSFLVVLNLGPKPAVLVGRGLPSGRVVLTTRLDREEERFSGLLRLRGDEGVIVRLGEATSVGRTNKPAD